MTPYSTQRKLLKQLALEYGVDPAIIFTVDSFQGSERDVIVLSGGRWGSGSHHYNMGFLKDRRRMNVATSRSKEKLIILLNDSIGHGAPDLTQIQPWTWWCCFRAFLRDLGCEHPLGLLTSGGHTNREQSEEALRRFLLSMELSHELTPDFVRRTVSQYQHIFDKYCLDDVGPLPRPSADDGDVTCSSDDTCSSVTTEVPEAEEAPEASGEDPGVEVLPTAHQCLQVSPATMRSTLVHERFAKVTIKQIDHLFYLGAHDLSELQLKTAKDNENYIFYIIRGLARFTHYHVRRFYKQRWESYSEGFKQHRIRFLSVCETTIELLCADSSAHTEELFTRLYAGSALCPPGDDDWRWWTPFFYQYNLHQADGRRTLARRSLALLLPHSIAWSSTEHK